MLVRTSTALLVLALLACAPACKMSNPAFDGNARPTDSGAEDTADTLASSTTDSADAEVTGPSDSVSTDMTDAQVTDSDMSDTQGADSDMTASDTVSTETDSGTSDTGGNDCESLEFADGLNFKVVDPAAVACPEVFAGSFVAMGASLNGHIEALPCLDEGCESCSNLSVELEAYPADIGYVADSIAGECIFASYSDLVYSGVGVCEYGRASISYWADGQGETPLLLGSSVDNLAPDFAAGFFAAAMQNSWSFVPADVCDCVSPDECCLQENPPSIYDVNLGGDLLVAVDEVALMHVGGIDYDFELWQAQMTDSCGASKEMSWLVVPSP